MNWAPSVSASGFVVAFSRGAVISSLRLSVLLFVLLLSFWLSDSVLLLLEVECVECRRVRGFKVAAFGRTSWVLWLFGTEGGGIFNWCTTSGLDLWRGRMACMLVMVAGAVLVTTPESWRLVCSGSGGGAVRAGVCLCASVVEILLSGLVSSFEPMLKEEVDTYILSASFPRVSMPFL